jgi:hypothetical protein
MRDIGLEYIPKQASHMHKYHMRQDKILFIGLMRD